jgi:hypothetical protein
LISTNSFSAATLSNLIYICCDPWIYTSSLASFIPLDTNPASPIVTEHT